MAHALGLMAYKSRVDAVLNLRLPHPVEHRSWRCLNMQKRDYVVELTYEIPYGYSCLDIEKHIDSIYATCGSEVEIIDYAGHAKIRIFYDDLPDEIPFDQKMLENKGLLIGINREREPVYFHFENPHMLIAGETGFGKTVLLYLILYQLVREDTEISIIDMKGTSFLPFRSLPQVRNIAINFQEAHLSIFETLEEMRRRQAEVVSSGIFHPYPKYFLVIDEAAQLSPAAIRVKKLRAMAQDMDAALSSIAAVGRELGIHLIYCTQYPHHSIVNPQIRFNAGARVCFHVQKEAYSDVILDEPRAASITQKGRAIFKATGRREVIQVPYASREQWEKWLHDTKRTKGAGAASSQRHTGDGYQSNSEFLPF